MANLAVAIYRGSTIDRKGQPIPFEISMEGAIEAGLIPSNNPTRFGGASLQPVRLGDGNTWSSSRRMGTIREL